MLKKSLILISLFLFLSIGTFAQGDSAAGGPKASASPAPAKAVAFRPTKDQIKQGQQILITQKLYTGEATGVYGESRPAIKAYQKANGLEQTGKFDRATLDKMGIALTDKQKGGEHVTTTKATTSDSKNVEHTTGKTTAPSDGAKRPAPFQATTEQIKELQGKLTAAKLFTGEADGKRSDALKAAVTKYQEANGLKATGGINAATLQKMGIALTDKQKEQVAAQAAYDAGKGTSKQD